MNVLIADFDLFARVGGGQTFYRAVIEKHPQLHFSYLAVDEPADAPRPANARPIAYRELYRAEQWDEFDDFTPPRWCLDAFLRASNIARSVAGRQFDVVDLPDYEQFGMFLRPALAHHGVPVGTIALSLHGRLSTSVRMNWTTEGFVNHALLAQERMQYQAVDVRYGLSHTYLDEWRRQVDLPVQYFSPLRFIDLPEPVLAPPTVGPPDLCFVGRTEKCKGPDLFLDLAWWLPRDSYRRALAVGPESMVGDGLGSNQFLRKMIEHRQLSDRVELRGPMNAAELRALFASRVAVVLPSRYDTFNLAAAEALWAGCPTAIGSGAGICRFLRDTVPGVPYLEIPTGDPQGCLPQLKAMLDNYDGYRQRLVRAVSQARLIAAGPELAEIYRQAPAFDTGVRRELKGWYERLIRFRVQGSHEWFRVQGSGFSDEETQAAGPSVCRERPPCRSARGEPTSPPNSRNTAEVARHSAAGGAGAVGDGERNGTESVPYSARTRIGWKAQLKRVARAITTPRMRRRIRAMDPRPLLRAKAPAPPAIIAPPSPPIAPPPPPIDPLIARARSLHHLPERTDTEVDRKLAACAELLSESKLDRVRLWREMGRLESLRGNELLAATYRLRSMRLAGSDVFGDLPSATATLHSQGYPAEAEAAEALYGGQIDAERRQRRLLEEALSRHRRHVSAEWERIDDWRCRPRYKASVIVSLYNAADKLPRFLRAIAQQTLLRSEQAELILVDSGSPSDEGRVWRQLAGELSLPAVYARSHRRETIQAAWNRALSIARGDYVSFLGVDEMLVPSGLETLARELDADPHLDWVQADSLVTNVDQHGHWLSDVMTYDRADFGPSLAYLETCYLSAVGAMHRRDLHRRFGYYDGSFRGAGDTEFKNRVLPFIRVKTIPQTLGIFWNYPDARTTSSPLAELEDLRAWYLHRTPAGVRYAFERRDPAEAEQLLCAALRYRKSYCRHWSTDVEYAQHLARFVAERNPTGQAAALGDGIDHVLGVYRSLDLPPRDATSGPSRAGHHPAERLTNARRVAEAVARQQARLTDERVQPVYEIFNDNRHEQHANIWRAA